MSPGAYGCTALSCIPGSGIRCVRCRGAAQQRPHPGQQFARLEGLGQVVVGADLQTHDAVGGLTPRREHQDRHRGGCPRHLPDLAAHVQTVPVGQHQVQQHQPRHLLSQRRQTFPRRSLMLHGKAGLPQIAAHHVGQAAVIVDQQNLGRRHGKTSCRKGMDNGETPGNRHDIDCPAQALSGSNVY